MQRSKKRKQKHSRSIVVRAPLASAVLLALSPAYAQEPSVLGEVVVTAQKRGEQSLQDVPMSIQAIGSQKLEELNITKFDDYVKFLPSVSYQSFGPGAALVYMRGVSSGGDGNHSGPLPSVGVYLDEQPITTITGALDVHLYDIARVEALAGPQGTLYGASSQAGTIRIITNKPDPSGFSASYGIAGNAVAEGDMGYLAEGHVNIPLTETAAIRLVGWARHDAGYIDNVAFQRTWPACEEAAGTAACTTDSAPLAEEDFNDVDTYGARAALRVDLNDSWTVTPTIMYQRMYADGVFGYDTWTRNGAPVLGELETAHVYPDWSKDKWWQAALTVEGKVANLDVVYTGAYLDRQIDSRLDYSDYSYFYDALYSYSLFLVDDNDVPTIGQYIWGDDGYKKMSHELRISTPQDRRLRFVGGLFYQEQTHDITQRYWIDDLAASLEVTGWDDTIWLTQQERRDEDQALFGELSFDITDKFTATGGLRFYKFDNTLEGFFGYSANASSSTGEVSCPPGAPTYRGAPCKYLDKGTDDDDYIGKLNLTYKFNDDHLAYATWSEGFRPGGINRRGTLPPYLADFLTNYELGWKSSWAGGTLRFNGALFQEQWDDFQFALLGQSGLTEIKNAAEAEIKGVEMDLTWAVTDAFQISGGVAFIDAELTAPYCGFVDPATEIPVAVDPCPDLQDLDGDGNRTETFAPEAAEGTQLPVTPEFKANLTLRQAFQLGDWDSFWRASLIHKGKSRADLRDFENGILGDQPSYEIVDLSAGIAKDAYSFELFVNNLTDERTVQYRYVQCAESICGAQPYVSTTPPRTIGLKFTQRFGEN